MLQIRKTVIKSSTEKRKKKSAGKDNTEVIFVEIDTITTVIMA
jgi:hypothetical protein